jgi:hypothetical protein
MSMSVPFEPNLGPRDDGIPAADPGAGAPEPAPGYGPEAEEPDLPEEPDRPEQPDPEADARAADGPDEDPPFRTPDPADASHR